MRAFLARRWPDVLQVLGGVALVVGISFAFGYALGLVAAGVGLLAAGLVAEGDR